jgi:rhodanese-related sulfurtransferase
MMRLPDRAIKEGGPIAIRVDRDDVQRLVADEAAQVVEVLPAAEYEDEHIAGAISIPLKELDEQGPRLLDRGRPVIVYCYHYQ